MAMTLSQTPEQLKLVKDWDEAQSNAIEEFYQSHPERRPINYSSNQEALEAIIAQREEMEILNLSKSGRRNLSMADAAQVIAETVALVAVPVTQGFSLAVYDYDAHMYSYSSTTVLNDYIVALLGSSSQSMISAMTLTLLGLRHSFAKYNPLPKHKIAVGNGIFNCLTRELEDFTPEITVLTKVSTCYYPNAKPPVYEDGFTLEGMIESLANGKPERMQLIGQICKAILTEHSLKPALFIILGNGGDGKSTFFTMLANMIGQENVAYVNFSEFDSQDKMLETMNKKLVLGLDNDVKIYIRKTALVKTMSSHEMITLSRKYLSAISVPFTATVVQLCNEFPRIAETGSSMRRRLVPFKAEYSHYEHGTENDNIDNLYIKDKQFLEYALSYFLNEETTPYYSDFNDVDREVALSALEAEDNVGQFVTELERQGIVSDVNTFLPTSHLYAAYQDWMEESNVGSAKLSARGFSMKIRQRLHESGYSMLDRGSVLKPSSLEKTGQYNSASWGELADAPYLSAALESNRTTRVFEKTHASRSQHEVRRKSHPISAIEYFNLRNDLKAFAEETNRLDVIETISAPETLSIQQSQTRQEESQQEIEDNLTRVPYDIRVLARNRDVAKMDEYISWLRRLETSYADRLVTTPRYISLLDSITQMLEQIGKVNQDAYLIGLAVTASNHDIEDKVKAIISFVEALIDSASEVKS